MVINPVHYALIDGHVHFRDCFDAGRFLNCASANFARAAATADVGDHYSAYLLLTETAHAHWFGDLSRRAGTGRHAEVAPAWTVRATADPRQLKLRGPECVELNVVSWPAVHRKIVRSEALRSYGMEDLAGPWGFARNQIAVQLLRKRLSPRSSA